MTRSILVVTALLAAVACGDRANSASDTAATPAAATPVADTTLSAGQTTAMGAGEQQGRLLDPNTATREQLAVVPGLDTASVSIILAGRPYADMIAVDQALSKKMTPEQRKTLYAKLWKPIDLNKAKGEEILLIPGVGNRMKHEFEEYRPYTSIEQFRREIGKYVNRDEVARLELYVSVKP